MRTRTYLSALVYMMVQAVLFGIGTLALLWSPLHDYAVYLFPVMIAVTALLSIPIAVRISAALMKPHHHFKNHVRMIDIR